MKTITVLIFLTLSGSVLAGGNKELMNQAESELRDVNNKVLKQVPKDQIPENGRVQINAKVKSTKPEPIITNVTVKIIGSN